MDAALNDLVRRQAEEIRQLRKRLQELEGKNPTQRLDEAYSLTAEEKRRQKQDGKPAGKGSARKAQKPERRGRRTTQDKVDQAETIELVIPDGFEIGQCTFDNHRPVWRIIDGKAVLVVYEIYRAPNLSSNPLARELNARRRLIDSKKGSGDCEWIRVFSSTCHGSGRSRPTRMNQIPTHHERQVHYRKRN